MKIDRLLAILNVLTERGRVTAPELSELLEVSRRTINRDIDCLSMAGIAVVTEQGRNGGIYLMEGYTLNKRVLKKEELSDIIAGLKGIESVNKSLPENSFLKTRISNEEEIIIIDLASHYKDSISEKIHILKAAIKEFRTVEFLYYSPSGKSVRKCDPYKILYKWSDWYLLAKCHRRGEFRFFKLNRLWKLKNLDEHFEPLSISDQDVIMGKHIQDDKPFEVIFDKSLEYMIVESYGPDCYFETDDGKLYFKGYYSSEEFIVRWLLSFGKYADLVSPESLIDAVKKYAKIF